MTNNKIVFDINKLHYFLEKSDKWDNKDISLVDNIYKELKTTKLGNDLTAIIVLAPDDYCIVSAAIELGILYALNCLDDDEKTLDKPPTDVVS